MTPPPAPSELTLRCRQGFESLSVDDDAKQTALENLEEWLTDPVFADYAPQLHWLIEQERWALLLDSFFRVIPFGTGGRRGPVGIGTNRFNPYTLATSVQGHAQFLRDVVGGDALSVVVVYDVRVFADLRGSYHPDLPNPIDGLTSRDFARIAAEVYAAMGVQVWMPDEAFTGYVSTPELSFSIRALGATAGLNISASHNHPDDNGGKFYNEHGGQHVPPHDEEMAKRVEAVREIVRVPIADAWSDGRVKPLPEDVHRRYIDLNVQQSLDPDARGEKIVFTALHGTSGSTVGEVLETAGFEVVSVPEQAQPDGAFPAVPFRAPNPEVPESMEMGIALADKVGAGAVMACDPDADRIGICARTASGDFRFFIGNEIAVLVADYKLERLKALGRLPAHPLVVKTEVTTELLKPVTEAFGGTLIGDLLVGFKYHGHVLERIERGELPGGFTIDDFIVGVEESHGVLVTPEIRDKDAAGAAILLAELVSRLREEGTTLDAHLDTLYKKYGFHANHLSSLVMSGAEGLANLRRIQTALRERPPREIAGLKVTEAIDHWDESGVHGPFRSGTDKASRDVLVFRLDGGARTILRPSGTEPKSKTYVEVAMPPLGADASDAALESQRAEGEALARDIADDLTQQMLEIIGVRIPRHALRVSGLVSLEHRVDFADGFVPELEERAATVVRGGMTREQAVQWVGERLARYGKDAPALVVDAMRAFLESARSGSTDADRAAVLDEVEAVFGAAASA